MDEDTQWQTNRGRPPRYLMGTRVFVELRNGVKPKESWPVASPTNWTLGDYAFDIVRFRPA